MAQNFSPAPSDTRARTEDVTNTRGTEFVDFSLKEELLVGIHEMGFERPSPIQEASIPEVLAGKDLLARAKNGTGKTASYLIPTLELIDTKQRHVQAIVLVPSRELALQTTSVCQELGKYLGVKVLTSCGGVPVRDDLMRLHETVHVVVGTIGRILDLSERKAIDVSKIKILVLDEADKLLEDSKSTKIVTIFPKKTQIVLFSATFPNSVQHFMNRYLKTPATINCMNTLTLKGVSQFYAFVEEKKKVHCLYTLFKKLEVNQSVIFCNSFRRVELLAQKMLQFNFSCLSIHSRMDQGSRNDVFEQFRRGTCRTLVCTDLITRGIDVQSVNVVINFDFPDTAETYLHRIGRSGRYGNFGLAVNLITEDDKDNMIRIQQELDTAIRPMPSSVDRELYTY